MGNLTASFLPVMELYILSKDSVTRRFSSNSLWVSAYFFDRTARFSHKGSDTLMREFIAAFNLFFRWTCCHIFTFIFVKINIRHNYSFVKGKMKKDEKSLRPQISDKLKAFRRMEIEEVDGDILVAVNEAGIGFDPERLQRLQITRDLKRIAQLLKKGRSK